MPVIRVDNDVQRELLRRRLTGERNHNQALRRAIREHELERQLRVGGLVTHEMAELNYLRGQR